MHHRLDPLPVSTIGASLSGRNSAAGRLRVEGPSRILPGARASLSYHHDASTEAASARLQLEVSFAASSFRAKPVERAQAGLLDPEAATAEELPGAACHWQAQWQ